ncbi:MAG: YigZ family protein [Clostridia bacterium]|nr:YigZ family protein [Clostridia bacterium]
MQSYRTVEFEAKDEFIEQRSRFIGYVKPVTTEDEALAFISEKRQKHWDATHNVYAYSLRQGQLRRYSDDGEPHGTAGMPVLDVILKSEVTDVAVVVTRYFGGILLGTGGLVRAYTKGARIALDAGGIITLESCAVAGLQCDYSRYGKIAALIPSAGGIIDDTAFTDCVNISYHIPKDNFESFRKQLTDLTGGAVETDIIDERYFKV